jgi:transcriptional regulator with XRE-family HTH domain
MKENDAQISRTVSKRLRQRREALGLSQADVAERVDVNPSYVGLLERGERVPSLDVLLKMCAAVELTPAELFADASPKPSKDPPETAQIRAILRAWSPAHRKVAVQVLHQMDKMRRP